MALRSNTYLFLAGGSIVLIGLALFGVFHFRKRVPQQVFSTAIIIEIDPGFLARQVVDQGVVVNFTNDNDDVAQAAVPVSFKGDDSPCVRSASQAIWESCQIKADARAGVYHYQFCPDLTSTPGDTTNCPKATLLDGELRVRDHKGGGDELAESSAATIYLGLTNYGQVNHFVLINDNLEWADRNKHKLRQIYFPPPPGNDPCGGENQPISTCTIQSGNSYKDYDYDCAETGCTDPTLHVRSQNPSPTTPLATPTQSSGSN